MTIVFRNGEREIYVNDKEDPGVVQVDDWYVYFRRNMFTHAPYVGARFAVSPELVSDAKGWSINTHVLEDCSKGISVPGKSGQLIGWRVFYRKNR